MCEVLLTHPPQGTELIDIERPKTRQHRQHRRDLAQLIARRAR